MDEQGKICRICGVWKPLAAFYRSAGMRDGHRNDCRKCNLARQAARYRSDAEHRQRMVDRARSWASENADRVAASKERRRATGQLRRDQRKTHLKRKYGITPDDYDRRLAGQGGGCAICGKPPNDGQSLHVDHDHESGQVRGLLCFRCNAAIGMFDDDIGRIDRALHYVAVKRRIAALSARR